jgi:general stress protein 26
MKEKHVEIATDNKELRGEEGLKKLAELMKGIRIAMLTTLATDGSISARPMEVHGKTFDGTLWFLARSDSEMVDQIARNQHVTLTLADSSESKYLALKGRASVNHDRAKIGELWNPIYQAWFPKGKDDPEITVLRVDVSEADYWEASSSSLVRRARYSAAAPKGREKMSVRETGHVLV